jgi:sialate O-acetylesterase
MDGKVYDVIPDRNGKWKTLVSTPIAGGPYNIQINGSDTIKLKIYISAKFGLPADNQT